MSWQVGLYVAAVLIPLAAFAVEAIFIRQLKRCNAYLATGAIGLSCLLSLIGFLAYSIETSGFYRPPHANARFLHRRPKDRPRSTRPLIQSRTSRSSGRAMSTG